MVDSIPPSSRKISLTAGLLYLLTFVSIPTLSLYGPIHDPNYIMGSGPDTNVIIGAISEVIVALAGIATAVVLFPVLKKQNESLSLGLVASRILEAACIFLGVAFLLSIVTLRQTGTGSLVISSALITLYDRIFLLSQSFLPAINDLLLGFLLYQSRLVPRPLALIGLIGAPILIAGYLAIMFGFLGQRDPLAGSSAILVALFELSLGIWLVAKGFSKSPIITGSTKK